MPRPSIDIERLALDQQQWAIEGTDVHIRRFRPGDGDRVRELNETAMATMPEYIPDAPEEDLQDVPRHYLDTAGEFLVGEVDGAIVATCAYTPPSEWKADYLEIDGHTTELTRMRVDPAHQRRGHGRAMYHELAHRAQANGYRRFVLDTGVENHVARSFYERLGFECRREVSMEGGEISLALALYEKSISW